MSEISVEELRRWSAEVLMGWKRETIFGMEVYRTGEKPSHCMLTTDILIDNWAPDLDTSPAWQILAVQQKLSEKGFDWRICSENDMGCIIHEIEVYIPRCNYVYGSGNCKDTEEIPFVFLKAAHAAVEGTLK